MKLETTNAAREAYDQAYLRTIARALESGGFPPPEALDRALWILDELHAWSDPLNFLPCQKLGLEEVPI